MSVNIEHGRRGGREPINTSTLFAEGVQSTEYNSAQYCSACLNVNCVQETVLIKIVFVIIPLLPQKQLSKQLPVPSLSASSSLSQNLNNISASTG